MALVPITVLGNQFTSAEVTFLAAIADHSYTDGQLAIGNTATHGVSFNTLTQGSGITITNGNGTITIASTGGGGSVTTVGSVDASITVTNPTTTPDLAVVIAPKWSTARNLAGNSVDGSANVAFANKFIVQGTTDAGLSGAQFLGALGTGIVKNTTTTGVLSIAIAADFPTLNQNTSGSAATLTTARTIGTTTGDATSAGSAFDGSANNTNALTLATVNGNVGSFTYASITVNAKGLITAASNGTAPGTVTAVSIATANGFSGSSSGGATPALTIVAGAITPTSVNGLTITTSTGTLSITNLKTFAVTNTLTLSGTDSTVMTFPSTTATIARTDAANTFTGHQTIEGVTSTGATGTGKFVFDTAPTFTTSITTPVIAAATNTSVNITSGSYNTIQTYTPSAAGTATLDLSKGNVHHITMPAGNITIAISNGSLGQCYIIRILQDGVGSRTVTWFTTIKWAGGTPPTLTTTASKADTFGFEVTTAGTAYDGYVVGQNI